MGLAQVKSDLLLARKNLANTAFQSTFGVPMSITNVSRLPDNLPWALAASAAWLIATVSPASIAPVDSFVPAFGWSSTPPQPPKSEDIESQP